VVAESMHATDRWEMQAASGCTLGTRDPVGLLRGLGLLVQGDQIIRIGPAKGGHWQVI
jgi:hypothetical protein